MSSVAVGALAARRPSTPVLVTRGLVKDFGRVRAVDGVSLQVTAGEIYALLGLNGAGKTTTIRMVLGMIAPTAGGVTLFGDPVTPAVKRVWSQVGHLVESPAAYPELTVRQNLRVVARLKRLPAAGVDEVVDRLGLRSYADRRAGQLSLGNQQRLGLAKALLGRPRLLVLDEPANGLDPAGVTEIRALLKDLAAAGTAILLSSHILAEVAKLASRIGIVHRGRMVTELAAAEVPQHVERHLEIVCRDNDAAVVVLRRAGHAPRGDDDGRMLRLADPTAVAAPERIATLLVEAGCPPVHLAVHEEDLESLFLRLTGQGDAR